MKVARACVCSINESSYRIFVRFLFEFCLRVTISKVKRKSLYFISFGSMNSIKVVNVTQFRGVYFLSKLETFGERIQGNRR